MPTATLPTSGREDLVTLRLLWGDIKRDLRRAKHLVDDEIRNYPTPIPRCDAQFNHLYEQQARLARELDRIGELAESNLGHRDYIGLIEEFIASAPYAGDGVERELRSRLKTELSAIGK